jgi:ubiquinone biosynthesis protein
MTAVGPLAESLQAAARTADQAVSLIARCVGHVQRLVDDVRRDADAVARDSEALYAAIAERAVGMRDAVRASPRFARIVGEMLRLTASYRAHAARAEIVGEPAASAALERLHRRNAERLYAMCVELRGGALKVGQFVSSRVDLLPPAYVDALGRLQDRVPPLAIEAIRARIEHELGAPLDDVFSELEPTPLAAASLAQVHGAVLRDGTRVAVKVQVPGIEDIIETDLAAFRVAASVLRELVPFGDIETIASELSRSVREELDFRDEAKHAAAFAARLADHDDIIVPRVVGGLSTRRVLVLERIDGERLIEFLDRCEREGRGAERDRVLAALVRCFCAQVLEHGAFHADPHPGNFLVVDGPKLVMLDYGSVQTWTDAERGAYARLGAAILAADAARTSALLAELGFATASGDDRALAAFAEMLMGVFRDGATAVATGTIDPRAQLARGLDLARAHPIARVPHSFVLLGRVFGSLGGLLLRYRPQIDLFRILAPYLAAALARPEAHRAPPPR